MVSALSFPLHSLSIKTSIAITGPAEEAGKDLMIRIERTGSSSMAVFFNRFHL